MFTNTSLGLRGGGKYYFVYVRSVVAPLCLLGLFMFCSLGLGRGKLKFMLVVLAPNSVGISQPQARGREEKVRFVAM
jgi:hypothetical protein